MGSLWIADLGDRTASRIDPSSGRVVETISLGSDPVAIVADGDTGWVTRNSEETATRIDER